MILAATALSLAACTKKQAQLPEMKVGQMTAYELDGFRLHVYNSNDVMADASYIIEGKKGFLAEHLAVTIKSHIRITEAIILHAEHDAVLLTQSFCPQQGQHF